MDGQKSFLFQFFLLCSACAGAQSVSSFVPSVHGTVRGKYEYQPEVNEGRFEVRNARVSLSGDVTSLASYKAEIDFSDEGSIKMLDAYVRVKPLKSLDFTVGQMRVPFTVDAHRSPHLQFFANRSFIAKQVGNVRDVGAVVAWRLPRPFPATSLEAGIFNGSGLTGQKDYWTKSYNFSVKLQSQFARGWNLELSCQQIRPASVAIMMWDAGLFFQRNRWHVEAEYLRKNYAHGAFSGVDAVDAFACYRLPVRRGLSGVSFLGRYDYMSDHSDGTPGEDGRLAVDDAARHRATAGVTLHLGNPKLQADIRLNYEKYFYEPSVQSPAVSERDKLVVELVCHF